MLQIKWYLVLFGLCGTAVYADDYYWGQENFEENRDDLQNNYNMEPEPEQSHDYHEHNYREQYTVDCQPSDDEDTCVIELLESEIYHKIIQFYNSFHQIKCKSCDVNYVPSFILEKDVKALDFSHSRIISLAGSKLHFPYNLLTLNVSHNTISELTDSSFFSDAINLEIIDLSYNNIATISDNFFSSFSQLAEIFLNNNLIDSASIGNIYLKVLSLKNNNNLKELNFTAYPLNMDYLDISNTMLEHLTFGNVEHIEASNSKLSAISFSEQTKNLKIANFSYNNLSKFNGLSLENVEQLDLSHNCLVEFFVANSTTLKELKLQNNNLSINLDSLKELSGLQIVDLSFNKIGNCNVDSFSRMTNLEILILRNCNLKNIEFGLFSSQSNLKVLDIAYNELESIDFIMLSDLKNLLEINIDGNNVKELNISTDFHQYLPKLERISFSIIPWHCPNLSAVILYLNKFEIEVYVNPKDIVRNKTNVRGIECYTTNQPLVNYTSTASPPKKSNFNNNDHFKYIKVIENKINKVLNDINQIDLNRQKSNFTEYSRLLDQLKVLRVESDRLNATLIEKLTKFKSQFLNVISRVNDSLQENNKFIEYVKKLNDERNTINMNNYNLIADRLAVINEKIQKIEEKFENQTNSIQLLPDDSQTAQNETESLTKLPTPFPTYAAVTLIALFIFLFGLCCYSNISYYIYENRDSKLTTEEMTNLILMLSAKKG